MVECVTADCQNRADSSVTCEGEGAFPYCRDCAAVLLRGGESLVSGRVFREEDVRPLWEATRRIAQAETWAEARDALSQLGVAFDAFPEPVDWAASRA